MMANLEELAAKLREEGYTELYAEARVCQDIVLKAIETGRLNQNVTVKGGVVLRSITGSIRRATRDLDLDFLRYPLEDGAIRRFVEALNCLEGITLRITGEIEELSQQEYRGKRVHVIISDDTGHSFVSKIDLGVHKNMRIEQEEYCFDVCMDEDGASLLINSKEQIFAEKLRSLLRFGPVSTRYKDIFDLCWLSERMDPARLSACLHTYILDDPDMRETSMAEVCARVERVFGNRTYRTNLQRSTMANWLGLDASEAFARILAFLRSIS